MTLDSRIGVVIGGYRIEAEIGRGGMGVVYRAEQLRLGRLVALKLIAPDLAQDPDFRDRFERESRLAASIEHPNVVPVHEAGEADGLLYICMRYVEGTDLRALIRQSGRLYPARAADVVAQVGAALDAAHARGLVHRDVKPANILVARLAERDHAYLTDFGLTKRARSTGGPTRTGQWVGTADYVAPEQIEGRPVDARSDVYSLGCVLYQALTGQVPFPRDSEVATMFAHLQESPPSVLESAPDVPPAFDAVVERAMTKEPAARYPSAGDLGRAAVAAAEGRAPTAPERSVAVGAAAGERFARAATTKAAAPLPAAPTAILPGPRMRRLGIRLAAAVVGVGIAVAGLVAGGVLGGDETARPTRSAQGVTEGQVPGEREPKEQPPAEDRYVAFRTAAYSAEYPRGWTIAEDDVLKTTFSRSRFVSPNGSLSVLIDHSPGEAVPAPEKAADVERAVSEQTSGYERLSFDEVTIGAQRGVEWTYTVDSTRKIDIFLNTGQDGFAVLGEGAPFERAIEIARHVAASVEPLP